MYLVHQIYLWQNFNHDSVYVLVQLSGVTIEVTMSGDERLQSEEGGGTLQTYYRRKSLVLT